MTNARKSRLKHRREEVIAGLSGAVVVEDCGAEHITEIVKRLTHPTEALGLLLGWAQNETQFEEVETGTRENLEKAMGDKRTGPVTWWRFQGDQAHAVLNALTRNENREAWTNLYRRTRALVREHPNSFVVIVTAPGKERL